MITVSQPTRRLTDCAAIEYTAPHVHPLSSSYRTHFRRRFHRLQVCVFHRLLKQKELVQTARSGREERAEKRGDAECSSGPRRWRSCHGWRSKRSSRYSRPRSCSCSASTCCRPGRRACDSRPLIGCGFQKQSRNIATPCGFSSRELIIL
jgi:hypothetical protein